MIHHNGRLGGLYTLYAKSSQAWLEWKAKLEEAICLRRVARESNKVFEVETLSVDTFSDPALMVNPGPSWNCDWNFTGKVTCSVPFSKRIRISTVLDTDVPDLQPLLMVMVWQLDVLKECGLGSGMIHGVCIPLFLSRHFLTLGVRLAMRRVLHLRMVSQCAVLEDFGLFLVLADGVRDQNFWSSSIPLTALVVTLRLSHRSTSDLVIWSDEHIPDTSKT